MSEQPEILNLCAESFPFCIKIEDKATGELLHEQTVPSPGLLTVPGFGRPTRVTVIFGNGNIKVAE